MQNTIIDWPKPENEMVYDYLPQSEPRQVLTATIQKMERNKIDIPLVIGGKEIRTGNIGTCRIPHRFKDEVATYHMAGPEEIMDAVKASQLAWAEWSRTDWKTRAMIFSRMADLLAGQYRQQLNAATMLGQSKTVYQAEIDAACELIDFLRFNVHYMAQIYKEQPIAAPGTWNRMDYRPLEGFVFAVTPFNFTAIAGNLPSSAAIMGNTVLWKPASSAVYSAYHVMKLFEAAGLPPGVINFIPGQASQISDPVLSHPQLAGIHFTGSTIVFNTMWKTIGNHIQGYRSYPRIVGETGGKDFVLAHASANIDELTANLIRGAFEFQGQKCSAASRAYIPDNLWGELKERLLTEMATIRMGDVSQDLSVFMGAVIDENAFDRISSYIQYAEQSDQSEILFGGKCDNSEGFFIEPTLIQTTDPSHRLMEEEIFGPVLTVFVYPENHFEETLALCNNTSPYGLTGAIFAHERKAVEQSLEVLRYAAGNIYVNDKPTGAVVGQQPFGGARKSGTNDKAGSLLNLLRWVSPRNIKETFVSPTDYRYPYMS